MFSLKTSKGCAWRAFYLYWNNVLILYLGIDPTFQTSRARVFGAVAGRKSCVGGRTAMWGFSFLTWRSRYWWRLDGRRK